MCKNFIFLFLKFAYFRQKFTILAISIPKKIATDLPFFLDLRFFFLVLPRNLLKIKSV